MDKDMKAIVFMVLGLNSLGAGGYMLFEVLVHYTDLPGEAISEGFARFLLVSGIVGVSIGLILGYIGFKSFKEARAEEDAGNFTYWQPPVQGNVGVGQNRQTESIRSNESIPPPPPPEDDDKYFY
ncbi:MAG: hypothetical protein JSV49_07825 [Thermoplasmata archaeon]|nr:MAG: hypothetical protein JSV49_07825 [Thermoplasmata archaeon]